MTTQQNSVCIQSPRPTLVMSWKASYQWQSKELKQNIHKCKKQNLYLHGSGKKRRTNIQVRGKWDGQVCVCACEYICVSLSAAVKQNDRTRAKGLGLPSLNYFLSTSRGYFSLPLCLCVCDRLNWPHKVIDLKVNWAQVEHLFLQIDIQG